LEFVAKFTQYAEIWIKNICKRENADPDLCDFYDCRIGKINRKMQTRIYVIFMIVGLDRIA